MTDLTPKPADSPQKNFSNYINLNNRIAMLGIGFVCAILAMSIANGLDMLRGVIIPTPHYLREAIGMRYVMIIASALGGFTLGWILSPKAKPFRTLLLGGFIGVVFFLIAVDYGALGWGSAGIATWVAFFMGLGYWLRNSAKGFSDRFKNPPTTFGSSKWANEQELKRKDVVGSTGIPLGTFKSGVSHLPLHYMSDQHGVTIGGARTKKGTSFVVPTLLTYQGSMLVLDPKGENAMITAKHREGMGQEVHVVDPFGITGLKSSCYNPLDVMAKGDVDIGDKAMLLADSLVPVSGGESQFFDHESIGILSGCAPHVKTAPSMEGKRNLGEVRNLLIKGGDELQELFKDMAQSPYPIVKSTGQRCLQKDEKLLSNVLATVQSHTHFLDSPRLQENLSRSDFKFEDLKTKPMTIYLVLPADKLSSHGRWLRLLIQQALTVNAQNIEVKPERPILFILDELPALGHLAMVEQAFGLMAGFGMQLHVICQSAAQLKSIYKDNWENFFSNSGVIQYLGSQDEFTSEYFSKLCGMTTVWNWSTAIAHAFGVTHSKDRSTSNTTTNSSNLAVAQRKLAFADELRRMDVDQQLLIIRNCNPIMAQKQEWFKNPELKDLGVNLYAKDE